MREFKFKILAVIVGYLQPGHVQSSSWYSSDLSIFIDFTLLTGLDSGNLETSPNSCSWRHFLQATWLNPNLAGNYIIGDRVNFEPEILNQKDLDSVHNVSKTLESL